jgi:hypothetical protein
MIDETTKHLIDKLIEMTEKHTAAAAERDQLQIALDDASSARKIVDDVAEQTRADLEQNRKLAEMRAGELTELRKNLQSARERLAQLEREQTIANLEPSSDYSKR